MEHFNVNFNKFMEIVTANQSGFSFEKDELDEVHRVCAYHGLWDENGYGFDDRRNSVCNLIAAIQGIRKAKDFPIESEEHFRVDFDKFMSVVTTKKSAWEFEKDELDEIYRACAYHGLFDEENYGFDDRRNSVSNLISALQEMIKSTAGIEAENNQAYVQNKASEEPKQSTWHVRINNGVEQTITTKTSQYQLAALAALAMLDYEEAENGENVVEIWVPHLLPNYGPYFYAYDGHQVGRPG